MVGGLLPCLRQGTEDRRRSGTTRAGATFFATSADSNGTTGGSNAPSAANEEQQTLAYFTVEEDDRYRVDVCNECKRYIKIVDFRDTKGKVDLDVEDIATLHLDILANDEGYD